jgi:peroxiredoxin
MSRALAFTIASALLTVGAGALHLAFRAVPPPARVLVVAAPPTAAGSPAPAAARAATRAGRRLGLDAALRELDLIRPGRPQAAQDFTVPLLQGPRFRLADHRAKVVLMNFWATWCLPCREEMPSMERLWRQHREQGFLLVAISVDSGPDVVKAFVTEHRLTFPIALDPQLEVAGLYGIRGVPASFIVDRQGQVAALALGPRAWDNDAAHSLVEELTR